MDVPDVPAAVCVAEETVERAQERHQRRQEVGSHIQRRAAALLIQETCVRVPEVRPGADIVCGYIDDLADCAFIDELPDSLEFRAEEGVRRCADEKTLLFGIFHDLIGLFQAGGQGLLTVDMLAGLQRLHGQAVVGGGIGENKDDVDFGIRHHLVGGVYLGNVPALCRGPGCLRVQIGTAHRAHVLVHGAEIPQIMVAIGAGADDAESENFFFHDVSPSPNNDRSV